jgi:hypothetical protein
MEWYGPSGKQEGSFSSFFFLWHDPKEGKGRKKHTFRSFGQKEEKDVKGSLFHPL